MAEVLTSLPADLAEMPPGPELAALLASVDRTALSGADRLRLLQSRNRQLAHEQAELLADLYAVSLDDEVDLAALRDPRAASRYPWAETEVAFALRWTRHAAGARLEQARTLTEDLPAVQAALSAGLIDMPKALVIHDGVQCLDPGVARPIVDKILDKAPEQTTGQIRARLRRMVLAADPHAAEKRARHHTRQRRVQVFLDDDQLAEITGSQLPPQRVAASWERITAIAKAAKAAGDSRKMDQLRADVMMDLLVGDGIAAGGPITNPDPGDHHDHHDTGQAQAPDQGTPWPQAPADPALLDFAADRDPDTPPAPASADEVPLPEPPPEDEPQEGTDFLAPFWSAGFEGLSPTPPGCPHCHGRDPGPMPAPRRGVVDIQIPLTTLAGLDELPAELAGFGPLLADVARQTVEQNPGMQWRFSVYSKIHELVAHGITGQRPRQQPDPQPHGDQHNRPGRRRTKRRPTTTVAAYVRARNQTCTAPGCRIPSRHCDLDHGRTWQDGGESDKDNLDPKCDGHHLFRHAPGTEITHTTPGFIGWTTPRGLQYLTRPTPPLYADRPPTASET